MLNPHLTNFCVGNRLSFTLRKLIVGGDSRPRRGWNFAVACLPLARVGMRLDQGTNTRPTDQPTHGEGVVWRRTTPTYDATIPREGKTRHESILLTDGWTNGRANS